MTKRTSIIILCVFIAIILFVGIFSFMPDGLNYGESGLYHSPFSLIQKSTLFTDEVVAEYIVDLDEGVNASSVVSTIKTRLAKMYGYYGCDVEYNAVDSIITISIPKTSGVDASMALSTEQSIFSSVTAVGKVEVSSETKYDESKMILKSEHFKSASVRKYNVSATTYYIAEAKLTEAGKKAASELTSSSKIYYYVDGALTYQAIYDATSGTVQLYSSTEATTKKVASYINNGTLGGELAWNNRTEVANSAGLVIAIVLAVLFVASCVFFVVRNKSLGFVGVLSAVFTIVAYVVIAGLIYSTIFNAFSVTGVLLGYIAFMFFTHTTLESIKESYSAGKTMSSAKYNAFKAGNKLNLIVHGIMLVVGIILWVIPSIVTAPLGCALVYMTICSFVATMGLNRLFVSAIAAFLPEVANRK